MVGLGHGIPHYYSPPSPSQGRLRGRWGCIDRDEGYMNRTGSGVDLSLDEGEKGGEGVCRCGFASVEGLRVCFGMVSR